MKPFLNYKWIKDNLTIIILIPTLLGGFWQVMELAYVGTPYIRFFSVSQLISDGIMILFVLMLVYFVSRFILWDSGGKVKIQAKPDNKLDEIQEEATIPAISKKGKKAVLKDILVYVVILSLFFGLYWRELYRNLTDSNRLYTFQIPFIVFGIVIPITLIGFIIKRVLTIIDIDKLKGNKVFNFFTSITAVGLFFSILFGLTRLIPWVHNSYLLADDFKNTEYLGCKIRKGDVNIKSYNIEYFNDKYIFVELWYNKNTSKTEVFKFDDFFGNTQCANTTK